MLMLGISTSSKFPSAAVSDGEKILSFVNDTAPGKSHSEALMGLIDRAVSEAGADKRALDAIAVDIGPGSFTGVRIGVSCANAMALAFGIPVIPVCSLAAMSRAASDRGIKAIIVDCRNGNCYAAVYEDGSEKLAPCAAVTRDILSGLPEGCAVMGDAPECGTRLFPDAGLVLMEAQKNASPVSEAVPMYLRPSQAERMKTK